MLPEGALLHCYYRSALTALRYLDERSGKRRFGADADARWSAFAGDESSPLHTKSARPRILSIADRVDLLLRDADVQWPNAFGARTIFNRTEVAEDDAFGHDWPPYPDAEALWRQTTQAPPIPDLPRLFTALSTVWDLPLAPFDLPPLRPHTRWLLRGPSAVAAAILAFAADPALLWPEQVIVVAGSPLAPDLAPRQRRLRGFTRQLAALAAGLLAQPRPTRLLSTLAADDPRGHDRLALPEEDA